jgi:hypothetical protein
MVVENIQERQFNSHHANAVAKGNPERELAKLNQDANSIGCRSAGRL